MGISFFLSPLSNPLKGVWIQTQAVLFLLVCKGTRSHILLSLTVMYMRKISLDSESSFVITRGLPRAEGWTASGFNSGTHAQSHVSDFSCSEHYMPLIWLIPGCSSLVSRSAEWRKWFPQCQTTQGKCAFPPKLCSVFLPIEHMVEWKAVGKWWHFKEDKQSELSNHSLSSPQTSCQNKVLIQLIKY